MPKNPKFDDNGQVKGSEVPYIDLISSENKEPGWRNFMRILPELVKNKGSTTRELVGLHELTTYGAEFPALSKPGMEEMFIQRLCFNDHPDPEKLMESIRETVKWTAGQNISITKLLSLANAGFKPFLRVDMRSDIRSLGKRRYDDGHEENVFDSHTLPFVIDDNPKFFQGLTLGLDELYQELCERYDGMWGKSSDFKQKLLAEIYLQLIGTRLLHPFWDGNGRTFGAHLVTALNRMGFNVTETPKEKDIFPDNGDEDSLLAYPNDRFMVKLVKPLLLTRKECLKMLEDFRLKNEYMKKLHKTIKKVIETGFMETEYKPYMLVAYHHMRVWLHQNGFMPYTENKPEVGIDQSHLPPERVRKMQKLARKNKLEPGHIDFSRFRI